MLYAGLAVMTPTGIGGAVTEAELIAAGAELGLAAPPLAGATRGLTGRRVSRQLRPAR